MDACDVKGGYLPSPSQLRSAAAELGNVGAGQSAEWTDSSYEENGNLKATVVGGEGSFQYRRQDVLRPYRCIMPLF
ncbi:MAG: hypothetical protein ACR2K6_03385 [Solirubrobacterales bacterium]